MGGGDKALKSLGGRPLLAHVIDRLRPQVDRIAINANGDPARFAAFGLPVVADPLEGFAGPLAGILAGLMWAAETAPRPRYVASVAADAPFLPRDLVARMAALVGSDADMATVSSGSRTHPVFGLWPLALADALRAAVVEHGVRKVDAWTGTYRVAVAAFENRPFDPFLNINTPDDLAAAADILQEHAP